jgi:hypothetical protein
MESLLWARRERVRPTVRSARPAGRGAEPTASQRGRLRIAAAGVAAVTVVLGIAGIAARPDGPGTTTAAPALAAMAPDIAGRPWLARRGDGRSVWGRAGAADRSVLPEDESGLAIGGHWLASGVSTVDATRVRVRDLETGAVVLDEDAGFRVAAAALAGDRLFLTGYAGGSARQDAGVVAVDIPEGATRRLVDAGPFPGRLGASPAKGDFQLSASGKLAAVNTCGSAGCDTVVIDVATLATSTPQVGGTGFLRAVTDEVLVLTDADGRWIKGTSVRTGGNRFTIADAGLMEPASMADGRVIADVGGGSRGWQVAAFGADGNLSPLTDLARAPGPWVWPSVSSSTVVVLGDTPFDDALAGGGGARNTLVRGADLHQIGTFVVQPGE